MEYIMSFLGGEFDPSTLLPDLTTLLDKVEPLLRCIVLAGPVVLLVLGLIYLLIPPKEANHHLGYQFFWGKSSVEAWRFTQKLAGIVWAVLGLVLGAMGLVTYNGFQGMEAIDMVWGAIRCVLWQLGLVAVSVIVIDITVVVMFNSKGQRRNFGKNKEA